MNRIENDAWYAWDFSGGELTSSVDRPVFLDLGKNGD
jgi:hypothetical protein